MIRKIACLVVIGLFFAVIAAVEGSSEKEEAAVAPVKKWLKMVDQGRYAESWRQAATIFRNVVNKEQWKETLQAVRKPLGKLLTRKVKTKTYRTSLPGAPDGEYVVIEFNSSFEKKKSAVETVTSMMDKDGKWRVAGYFIE